MTSVDLGMPAAPPPVLAPRRKTRQIKVGKVLVGGDAPVSVQSMTTTLTADVNTTLQQIAELTAAGCDIVRVACPSQDDADALAAIAQHSQIPVIADIHFQPKYVFAAIDAGCAAVRVNPGNIRKFDDQVKQIAPGRQGPGYVAAHRRQRRVARQAAAREVRQGHAGGARRVGGLGGVAVRGARLPRLQDLGQAQRPGRDGAGLRDARRARRLAAAPRRHRGGPGVPGHDQERDRVRGPALQGHRRHDPRLAVRASGRGGQGRHPDPPVAEPAAAQARDRLLPVVRAGAGRRLQARRRGDRRPGGHGGAPAGRGHGLRRERARRGPRGRPRASPPATARARSSSGARSSRPCPSRRSWRR